MGARHLPSQPALNGTVGPSGNHILITYGWSLQCGGRFSVLPASSDHAHHPIRPRPPPCPAGALLCPAVQEPRGVPSQPLRLQVPGSSSRLVSFPIALSSKSSLQRNSLSLLTAPSCPKLCCGAGCVQGQGLGQSTGTPSSHLSTQPSSYFRLRT